jgi:hypothetical protein
VTLTNINSVKSRHSRHIFATMNIIGKNKKSPEWLDFSWIVEQPVTL